MALRILLADDHQILRHSLRALLEREGLEVVAEAEDGERAVELVASARPDVAVLDLSMPRLNGIEAARAIARAGSGARVVLLTVHREEHYVLAALKAGIMGYVLKTQAAGDLLLAIREVADGGIYLSPGVSRAVVDAYLTRKDGARDPLSPREREVLRLIAEGKTTKEIAALLGLSVKTADSHRTRLMEKLDIHDVAGLTRYAIRNGFIQA
ncbi:MAG: response regulator transcription factor [Candidatus Rokubacteria bacterium]|nr:response regulator transcription factor [Candidatus Rokubacteria bacterium]